MLHTFMGTDGANPNVGVIRDSAGISTARQPAAGQTVSNLFVFTFGNEGSETIYSKDTFPPGPFYLVAASYDGSESVFQQRYAEAKSVRENVTTSRPSSSQLFSRKSCASASAGCAEHSQEDIFASPWAMSPNRVVPEIACPVLV